MALSAAVVERSRWAERSNRVVQVAYHFGTHTKELLEAAGVKVDFKTYKGMGHSVRPI